MTINLTHTYGVYDETDGRHKARKVTTINKKTNSAVRRKIYEKAYRVADLRNCICNMNYQLNTKQKFI